MTPVRSEESHHFYRNVVMKILLVSLLPLFLSCQILFAGEHISEFDQIPIMVNTTSNSHEAGRSMFGFQSQQKGSSEAESSRSVIAKLPAHEVQELISNMRHSLCNSLGEGNLRFWITAGALSKGETPTARAVISANGETGIEVAIHCGSTHSRIPSTNR